MEGKKGNKLTQIEIFLAVSVVLILVLSFFPNLSITGYVFMNPYSQELDMVITESQSYILTSDKTTPFQLISFRLSGTVSGSGRAEISLESAAGQELLVYSNVKERRNGLEAITGMAAGEDQATPEDGNWLVLKTEGPIRADFRQLSEEQEIAAGNFGNECVETCLIEMEMSTKNSYRLNFELEPGTTLEIREIIYNIRE